ncbi:hypothetical protein LTR97_001998 [Elasticomyces elasticus]|uniref:Uncharacterized protein n=1 Tax=Elasticomyces elasticus TaxID=574655 RepID=A0AAN7WGX9_9PEZI|nr:hypothetical protein LTR97_001998 [Elasticomyces elasticus]
MGNGQPFSQNQNITRWFKKARPAPAVPAALPPTAVASPQTPASSFRRHPTLISSSSSSQPPPLKRQKTESTPAVVGGSSDNDDEAFVIMVDCPCCEYKVEEKHINDHLKICRGFAESGMPEFVEKEELEGSSIEEQESVKQEPDSFSTQEEENVSHKDEEADEEDIRLREAVLNRTQVLGLGHFLVDNSQPDVPQSPTGDKLSFLSVLTHMLNVQYIILDKLEHDTAVGKAWRAQGGLVPKGPGVTREDMFRFIHRMPPGDLAAWALRHMSEKLVEVYDSLL